jgi:RND family efflux transporter MFP subunit
MKRGLILAGLILMAYLAASGCDRRKAGKPRLGEVERLPRVETVVLGKPARLEVRRSYTATVEALEKTELCAMVRGYIKYLPTDLDIGRTVAKNELLFSLHVPDLVADRDNKKALVEQAEKAEALALQAIDVARAEVKESQALLLRYAGDVEYRRVQHLRISKLAQGDTLSKQQVDEAKLQLDASQAALAAAQAQVVTKQSRLEAAVKESQLAAARVKSARTQQIIAEVQVGFAELRAPFDGIITKRWVDTGTTVKDAGMPLFTLARTDKVRVVLDVPERDVPYFRMGPDANIVELHVPAIKEAIGADTLAGRITLLASALDPVTRTMRAEMHLDNMVGDKRGVLRPQMTGTALVTLAAREAFTVPSSALVRTGNKIEIYIVADPTGDPARGSVKRLEVQTGLDDGLRVEIRNHNLTGRELVIAKGAGALRPGDQVLAVPAQAAE